MSKEQNQRRIVRAGNLSRSIDEGMLTLLFANVGVVKRTKLVRGHDNALYGLIEFESHLDADKAITTIDGRLFLGEVMSVKWATAPTKPDATVPMKPDATAPTKPDATAPTKPNATDTSNHHTIFVTNLDYAIKTPSLQEAFESFGEISKCVTTCKQGTSKRYGFVTFVNKSDAANAIQSMNGKFVGSRPVKTNWAFNNVLPTATNNKKVTFTSDFDYSHPNPSTQNTLPKINLNQRGNREVKFDNVYDPSDPNKTPSAVTNQEVKSGDAYNKYSPNWSTGKTAPKATNKNRGNQEVKFNDVFNQSGPNCSSKKTAPFATNKNRRNRKIKFSNVVDQPSQKNCTIRFDGIEDLTEDFVEQVFSRFGYITRLKVLRDKGYALVTFSTQEAATIALKTVNNTKIKGYLVKCTWSKESGDTIKIGYQAVTDSSSNQYSYSWNQGINDWYPPIQMQGRHAQDMQITNFGKAAAYNQYTDFPYNPYNQCQTLSATAYSMNNTTTCQMPNTNQYLMPNTNQYQIPNYNNTTLYQMPNNTTYQIPDSTSYPIYNNATYQMPNTASHETSNNAGYQMPNSASYQMPDNTTYQMPNFNFYQKSNNTTYQMPNNTSYQMDDTIIHGMNNMTLQEMLAQINMIEETQTRCNVNISDHQ